MRSAGIVIAFVLVVFVGDRLIAYGLNFMLLQSQLRFSVMYRGELPEGIVFVGNSRAAGAFHAPTVTRRLGIPAFNLAFRGMSTEVADAVIADLLERNPAPEFLVLEVTNLFTQNDLAEELKMYFFESERVRELVEGKNPRAALASQVMHTFAFNSHMLLRALYYLRRSDQERISDAQVSERRIHEIASAGLGRFESREHNLLALKRILRKTDELAVPVRLVVAPYLHAFTFRVANIDAWVRSLPDQLGRRIKIWDFSRSLPDPKYFQDGIHVNAAGARALLDQMIEAGVFEPVS